jgi:predicted Zn-dependent protease
MAAPFTPDNDAQVLERVPARAIDPAARELQVLRQAWRAAPGDLAAALPLAERLFDEVGSTGDPRYIGQLQAVLQPWWVQTAPPAAVRVLRAMALQFDHQFEAALADLDAALAAEPDNARAWAWRTAIQMVQADYAGARASCQRLAALAPGLIGSACQAQVDAVTGRAGPAVASLRSALGDATASPAQRLWSLTRLAEIEERLGHAPQAEAAFRQALGAGPSDVYLLAAYADFLLDQGRAAEVLTLLQGRGRADVLLLRLALAARATGDAGAAAHASALAARFAAARLRGDVSHRKEEARFRLALGGDVAGALTLARENWAEQREPADARVLLEAALAARDRAAAEPALQWMAASGVESQALAALASRLKDVK